MLTDLLDVEYRVLNCSMNIAKQAVELQALQEKLVTKLETEADAVKKAAESASRNPSPSNIAKRDQWLLTAVKTQMVAGEFLDKNGNWIQRVGAALEGANAESDEIHNFLHSANAICNYREIDRLCALVRDRCLQLDSLNKEGKQLVDQYKVYV